MDRKKILLILLLLPFFVFMSPEEEEHSSGLINFLGKTVNFIILFGGLTYLLYKPIRRFLEKRAQDIKLSLKEAEDSRKDAEQKLKGIETRLAGLEREIEKVMKEAEGEGRRTKEETLQMAQQETEKIKYFTKQEIERFLDWYDRLKDIKYASLRYFNAAGYDPKGNIKGLEKNPVNLIPIVMEVAAGIRESLKVFGNDYPTKDGTGVRDYIHVKDLARAHIKPEKTTP